MMWVSPNDVVPADADTNEKSESLCFRIFGTRNGNRTHNYPLGGGYYIHLTMQAVRYSIFAVNYIM